MNGLLLVLFFFGIAIVIGLVLRGIDRIWRTATSQTPASAPSKYRNGVARGAGYMATGAVLGNALYSSRHEDDELFSDDSLGGSTIDTSDSINDDLNYSPIYAHMPGNIYYHTLGPVSETGISDSLDSSPDLLTDPIYSDIPGNIYYTDDDSLSTSSFDDSFSYDSFSSSFDDDFGTSSISSSFDDDWSSSSFDD